MAMRKVSTWRSFRQQFEMVLIATSEAELQDLIDRAAEVSERAGLIINTPNTKVMISSKQKQMITVYTSGKKLEQDQSVVYLVP